MINSFADNETKSIFDGIKSKKLPSEIQNTARRKLRMIDNAEKIGDLKIPPGNRLEQLKGNFQEYYSIRINDQWRIKFKWSEGDAYEVRIIDYHK
jgi:proteic killer suppression protein